MDNQLGFSKAPFFGRNPDLGVKRVDGEQTAIDVHHLRGSRCNGIDDAASNVMGHTLW